MFIPYRFLSVSVGSGTGFPKESCPNTLSNNFFSNNVLGTEVGSFSFNNSHSVCLGIVDRASVAIFALTR